MSPTTTTKVSYDDAGTGSPVLLCLPGWCGPRSVFDPLVPLLAERHRVMALDWRGHGLAAPATGDFGFAELTDDAEAVIRSAGVEQVVPVALSHAGWVAIDLRRRLGADRVPKLVLLDWMVLGPPPPFLEALEAMRSPATTRGVVEQILDMWASGLDIPSLTAYLQEMDAFGDEMWQRAAREISDAFAKDPCPMDAIAALDDAPATVHLYAQPADDAVLAAQRAYSEANPWFSVQRLAARSHFPMFEVPDDMAAAITSFVSAGLPTHH